MTHTSTCTWSLLRLCSCVMIRTLCPYSQVPLYEKGYDRDAASVAADAIIQAKRDKLDVILIDTTGRMQDNTPLMRALSKLINTNKPDLVSEDDDDLVLSYVVVSHVSCTHVHTVMCPVMFMLMSHVCLLISTGVICW